MEIWKTIKEFEDYEISNFGRVKSLKFGKEKILKQNIDSTKYYAVVLSNGILIKTIKIHVLVAIAFLNHIPCGMKFVINHKNFNKSDNRVENLEIVSGRENTNKKHIKSTSKYVGVSWAKKRNKWTAQITINRKVINLGFFNNEYDAHLAYEKSLYAIKNI